MNRILVGLEHHRLKELVHYCPTTGAFTLLIPTPKRAAGTRIDRFHRGARKNPIRSLTLEGRYYKASRLAWFYMTGEWPDREVDHKEVDGLNNKWTNLRLATHSQNQANTRARKSNRLGLKGVYLAEGKYYRAAIEKDGRRINLGYFGTPHEAAAAYAAAAVALHGEFARVA